jgi:hypothetical protein
LRLINPSTSPNELNTTLTPHSIIHGDACFAYFNKIWGIPYYESSHGQFISQDPSFLSVGDPNKVRQVTSRDQQTFLADPQLANSYSYGRDNPITNKDPEGNLPIAPALFVAGEVISIGQVAYDVGRIWDSNFVRPNNYTDAQREQIAIDARYDFALAATGVGAARVAVRLGVKGAQEMRNAAIQLNLLGVAQDALDATVPEQIYSKYNQSQGPSMSTPKSSTAPNTARSSTPSIPQTRSTTNSTNGSRSVSYNQFVSNLSNFVASFSAFVQSLPPANSSPTR